MGFWNKLFGVRESPKSSETQAGTTRNEGQKAATEKNGENMASSECGDMATDEKRKKLGKIIAKAWADEEFKQRLLKDVTAVIKEEGLDVPSGGEASAKEPLEKTLIITLPTGELAGLRNGLIYGCRIGYPPYPDSQHDHWIYDDTQGTLVYVNEMALTYRLLTGKLDKHTPIIRK
jgi:hypothetical protein